MCSFQEKNISSLSISGKVLTLQTTHGNFLIPTYTAMKLIYSLPSFSSEQVFIFGMYLVPISIYKIKRHTKFYLNSD